MKSIALWTVNSCFIKAIKSEGVLILCQQFFGTLYLKITMGNAQSDHDESHANDIIQWIPGLNIVYGGIRSVVYAAKGDSKEAGLSAIRAAGTGMGMVLGAAGGPVASVAGNLVGAGVSEGLTIPIKNMPDKKD